MYTMPKIHTGEPIPYQFKNDTLFLNCNAKRLAAFILKPENRALITKTKIILVVYADNSTLQFTFEPYTAIPEKVRTKTAEAHISERAHNFENMSLVYAGLLPQ